MLSSLVIVLREFVEATLLAALLLLLAQHRLWGWRWFAWGLGLGGLAAGLFAWQLPRVTASFAGFGQEYLWAALLGLETYGLFALGLCLWRWPERSWPWGATILALALGLSLSREGSEILVYVAAAAQGAEASAQLTGAALGAGIGVCAGVLLTVLLRLWASLRAGLLCLLWLLAGLHLQWVTQLIQAGLLPDGPPLWDTSGLVAETSLWGQIAFSVFNYEAQPNALQVLGWLALPVLALLLGLIAGANSHGPAGRK